jgi:hypothetical protein
VQTGNCTDVNQAKIHQSYSVIYESDGNETNASAQFRFAGVTGTTLAMDGKCSIQHDTFGTLSKSMLSDLIGTSYKGSKAGYLASHVFTFTNNDGRQFINSITNQNTVALSNPLSSISRASGVIVQFTPAVAKDESVNIYIDYTDTQEGATTSSVVNYTNTEGATSVTLSAETLAGMNKDGPVYIIAKRDYSKSLDQASDSEGGSMSFRYVSPKSSATLSN